MSKTVLFDLESYDVNSMYPTTFRGSDVYVSGIFDEFNPKYWPHQTTVDWAKIHTIEAWCYANLKGRNWRSLGNRFAFKRGQDFTMFKLKWS